MQPRKRIHTLFLEEVLDMVVGHEIYSFLDEFSSYHQIMITMED
jgi:hypothetical protein